MTVAVEDHLGPWTEDEYFGLPESTDRIELFDGSLLVSPHAGKRHQRIAFLLARQLDKPAGRAGLLTFTEVNLRLATGRIFIPDILVADTDLDGSTVEAHEAKLVVEVVSPGNPGTDRVLKPHLYAAAGIPLYLRVEQAGGAIELNLHRLDGDHYTLTSKVGPGETLSVDDPFVFAIDVDDLLE